MRESLWSSPRGPRGFHEGFGPSSNCLPKGYAIRIPNGLKWVYKIFLFPKYKCGPIAWAQYILEFGIVGSNTIIC